MNAASPPTWGLRALTIPVALLALLTLWAFSVPGTYFAVLMIVPMIWMVLGLLWVVLSIVTLRRVGLGRTIRNAWLIGMATIVSATVLAVILDLPLRARFEASRGAMEAVAAEVAASPEDTLPDRPIGLFDAERIERTANGFRFLVKGSGFLSAGGFAFASSGTPRASDDAPYLEFVGPWWIWIEEW